MNIIETIATSLLSSSVLTVAVLWMARFWLTERLKQSIQHEYATRLESHKATLKAEMELKLAEHQAKLGSDSAQSLERMRADLQIAAAQRQLLHRHLHEREAEAIAETYENLSDVQAKGAAYVSIAQTQPMGSKSERREALNSALGKFGSRFRLHRLYLPRTLADSVQSFESEIFRRASRFAARVEPGMSDPHEAIEEWNAADEYMQKEAPALFDKLESEFRRRLGQEVPLASVSGDKNSGPAT
jgi:hypothetical protein